MGLPRRRSDWHVSARRSALLIVAEAQGLRLPAVMDCLASRDGDEGVRAFREKRAPVSSGQ
jgi:crotonobetainyl-CoA hydratase